MEGSEEEEEVNNFTLHHLLIIVWISSSQWTVVDSMLYIGFDKHMNRFHFFVVMNILYS